MSAERPILEKVPEEEYEIDSAQISGTVNPATCSSCVFNNELHSKRDDPQQIFACEGFPQRTNDGTAIVYRYNPLSSWFDIARQAPCQPVCKIFPLS